MFYVMFKTRAAVFYRGLKHKGSNQVIYKTRASSFLNVVVDEYLMSLSAYSNFKTFFFWIKKKETILLYKCMFEIGSKNYFMIFIVKETE